MISASKGFINQSEKYSTDNAGTSKSKYIHLKKGELAYNHGNSKVKKYGAVFMLGQDNALVPFVYHCFSINKNQNSKYWSYYLNTIRHDRYLRKIVCSTARLDGLLNISSEDYFKMPVNYPELDEQNKITRFLDLLYRKIELIEAKINTLKKYKKGLLQKYIKLANQSTKIFKISSVCDLISGYNFTPNDYCEDGIYEVITIGNVLDERYVEGPFKKVNIMPSESILLREDDLLISMTGNVGRTSFAKSKKQLLNQRVCKLNFYDQNNKDLVYFITKSDKFKRRMTILAQGGAQPNLKNKDILNFKCNVLANEQNNIFIKCYKLIDKETILLKEKYKKLHELKMQLMKDLFI